MLGRMGDTQRTRYRSERPNCPDVIFFKTRSYSSELHILVTITTFVNENQDDNQWQFHYLINAPPSATSWKFQTFNEFLRHNHAHCLLSTEPTQVVSSRYHLPPTSTSCIKLELVLCDFVNVEQFSILNWKSGHIGGPANFLESWVFEFEVGFNEVGERGRVHWPEQPVWGGSSIFNFNFESLKFKT